MDVRKTSRAKQEQEDVKVEQPQQEYLSDTDKKLQLLHQQLVSSYGDNAPMISQLEAWKTKYNNIYVSQVGEERKEIFVWRTLQRREYKDMQIGAATDSQEAFNEMLVEKCILFPFYDYQFRSTSDAGIISTLGQQISYKSGFVSPEEALSLVFVL